MLVLARRFGQWIHVTHAASGDVIRIRLARPVVPDSQDARLVFDDDARHFAIERAEMKRRPEPEPEIEAAS